jgi:hypothetical protein
MVMQLEKKERMADFFASLTTLRDKLLFNAMLTPL